MRSRMALTRSDSKANLIDVLDRVLDKGIVIDAWIRVTLAGIDLLTVEARASFETYLKYAENLARHDLTAGPHVKVSNKRDAKLPPWPISTGDDGTSS
jgi:gas vesicle structural protein